MAVPTDILNAFNGIAPEFATTPPETVDLAYQEASMIVSYTKFGAVGVGLAMAHILTLQARAASGGGVGPVTSETEGQLSRSWGNVATNTSAYWGTTSYGLRLWALMRAKLFGPRNRMM